MSRRFDANYHSPDVKLLSERMSSSNAKRLGDLTAICYRYPTFYGFKYQDSGISVLKGENITRDGELVEVDEPSFITQEIHDKYPNTHLALDDLVMSVRGEVGKVGLVDQRFAGGNINANTIRISLRQEVAKNQALPRFVWAVLNSTIGAGQIRRLVSGGVQETITAPEILDILIPLPLPSVQREMVREMQAAREMRRRKLEQADALLAGMDALLLARLGLTVPKSGDRLAFALRLNEAGNERFDPHFHHPDFRHLLAAIQGKPNKPLGEIAGFSTEQCDPANLTGESFRYIEISGVDRYTGEITANETPISEAPSRARMLVREGDIIVSLTRPHHGSIAYIDAGFDNSIASTGFAVIHEYRDSALLPHYLLAILRSSLTLQQMLQRSSGGNYPAITEAELKRILIPIPDEKIQREIVDELHRRRHRARSLREEVARAWEAAKARFEARLLGGEGAR